MLDKPCTREANPSSSLACDVLIMETNQVSTILVPSAPDTGPVPEERENFLYGESSKPHWSAYLWDTLDKPPTERRFLFKIDTAILTIASLGYFIKNLDQVNINNAFVSGMKEDLGLNGNQLNYMQTCWTVGYVIGQIPR